jgi:hypothetical protein
MQKGVQVETNAGTVTILEVVDSRNITVRFNATGYITKVRRGDLVSGSIRDRLRPSVFGVGYLGYKDIYCSKEASSRWARVLERCYSEKFKLAHPSYEGCSVADDWLNLSVFAEWFTNNPYNRQGWEIDKDILVKGNKVYSPETCVFVPACINTLLLGNQVSRGEYPIGVCAYPMKSGIIRYRAQCQTANGCQKKFTPRVTIHEAFMDYKIHKEFVVKRMATEWRDLISPAVYDALMSYTVEVTD